jgi:predicted NBD/HSP70 family sugar kinase
MAKGSEEVGLRSETVRRPALTAIVRELHTRGPLSRSELVVRTGLSRSAIRGLIGELAAAGLVSEERGAPLGTPGRPSPLVRLEPASAVVLAAEVAVASLAVALVGVGGHVFEVVRAERPGGHASVDEVVAGLAELIAIVRERHLVDDALIGIAVAVPGVVRRADGFVSNAPNLGWRDVPFGQLLAQALGTRIPIIVANESDLGALAELRRGAAIGADAALFIFGDVGVGGGLVVDGKPLTGVAGYAGEVGHIPVNPNGVACRCGSVGCWETEIGEEALLLRARHPLRGGHGEVDAVLREASEGSLARS